MIWPLVLLWVCFIGLAALLLVGAVRMTEDQRDVRAYDDELAGLGRCASRAQQFKAGPGSNRGSARTSRGVSSPAGRRA